jgi:Holliday junction resolvase-like predicted endonuclease
MENIKEAARKKSLGELGELFAIKALVDKQFDRIRNLNDNRMNEKFADIICEKDGFRYVISVKSRNKFQKNGSLNARYKLGSSCYEKALSAEKKYNASAYWMAIQFDHKSFSIYFGSLQELNGSKAIPIDKCEKGLVGEIWELNKRHYFDFEYYTNNKNSQMPVTIKA